MKAGRHHADDGVSFVVEKNILTDDVGRAAEAGLPQTITEDNSSIRAGPILLRQEGAAQNRLHAEQRKKICAHAVSLDFFRFTAANQVEAAPVHRRHILKALIERFPIGIVRRGGSVPGKADE